MYGFFFTTQIRDHSRENKIRKTPLCCQYVRAVCLERENLSVSALNFMPRGICHQDKMIVSFNIMYFLVQCVMGDVSHQIPDSASYPF